MLLSLLLSTFYAAEPELTPVQQAFLAECIPDANIAVTVSESAAVPGPCSTSSGPAGTLVTVGDDKAALYFILEDVHAMKVVKAGKQRLIFLTLG